MSADYKHESSCTKIAMAIMFKIILPAVALSVAASIYFS